MSTQEKSYAELLNLKWKGRKIALGSDNGALILSGLMKVWDRDKALGYFKQIAGQEPAIQAGSPSNRVQLPAAGEFPSADHGIHELVCTPRESAALADRDIVIPVPPHPMFRNGGIAEIVQEPVERVELGRHRAGLKR